MLTEPTPPGAVVGQNIRVAVDDRRACSEASGDGGQGRLTSSSSRRCEAAAYRLVDVSESTVGWLMLAAAALTLLLGGVSRVFIGRLRATGAVRGLVHTFRRTGIARVLFGRFEDDVLDDDELDTMILMPAIVIACGLCLTALFLLGYDTLA